MPNWIEGTMRIRGCRENIKKLMKGAFNKYSGEWRNDKYVSFVDNSGFDIRIDEEDSYLEINSYNAKDAYIEGTKRAFVDGEFYCYTEAEGSDDFVVCIPVKQAWGWFEEDYKKISDKYNVDIRLIGWEKGMEYEAECVVLRGQDPVYTEAKYDDWDWEAPCPLMGG